MIQTYKMEEVVHLEKIPARILHQMVRDDGCYVPLHWHKDIELNLMLLGNTEFTVNGKKNRVMAGELIVINSGDIHMGAPPAGVPGFEPKMELITILWDYDFLRQYSEYPALRFNLGSDAQIRKELRDKIIQIGICFQQRKKYYEMDITALLLNIGSLLMKYCTVPPEEYEEKLEKKTIYRVQEAVGYIEENYQNPLSLQQISEYMNLTPTYFSNKFRQAAGITFHECLSRCRLRHAVNDLVSTDMTVTEIAYQNGFPNVKSFIQTFKKVYQTTPQKYKKA